MEAAEVQPGHVLGGKYRLVERLGRGGMGEVWRAEQTTLQSGVAVKLMNAELFGSSDATSRFLREARAAAALRSPHVVQMLDYGVDDSCAYMVMELLEGESLAARLKNDGVIQPQELAQIMSQVARAVGRAHEAGIIHRDLKPDNIFLTWPDGELVTKVLDFGIAKFQREQLTLSDASTRTGTVMGTPYYMSPEQAEGTRTLDHRTDIWAMGVIAFECLTGRRPFDAPAFGSLLLKICVEPIVTPSHVAPVPSGFDEWFARMTSRNLDARFQSAREAAEHLFRICSGANAIPAPRSENLPHWAPAPTEQPVARSAPVHKAPPSRLRAPMLVLVGASLLAAAGATFVMARASDHGLQPGVDAEPDVSKLAAPQRTAEVRVPTPAPTPTASLAAAETPPVDAGVQPVAKPPPAPQAKAKPKPAPPPAKSKPKPSPAPATTPSAPAKKPPAVRPEDLL